TLSTRGKRIVLSWSNNLDAWLAGRKRKFPLPLSRFRKLTVAGNNSRLHFDGKIWPRRKPKARRPGKIEITVKPSALVILQPIQSLRSLGLILFANKSWRFASETFESTECAGPITLPHARSSESF